MTTKIRPYQIVILILLVLLPAVFLYSSRGGSLLIPYGTGNPQQGELIALYSVIYTVVSLPYWLVVGMIFSLWVTDFRRAFLLANLPIFINAVGEMLYYVLLGMEQDTYPYLAYLIGSHIDKFNPLSIFGIGSSLTGILLSTVCLLAVFAVGYYWGKRLLCKLS